MYHHPSVGSIAGNTIYQLSTFNGAGGYEAAGISAGAVLNLTIERNRIYHTDRGIGLNGEANGSISQYCIVRSNMIYHCQRSGIYLGGTGSGGTGTLYVLNNTLYFNNAVPGLAGENEGEISLRANCNSGIIRNNILYSRPAGMFVRRYNAGSWSGLFSHNLYYTSGAAQWMWNGTAYTDFNTWKAACGTDISSSNGVDPLFVNTTATTPDLHILPGSPARNTGIANSLGGTLDIDGQARTVGIIDKGADEQQ